MEISKKIAGILVIIGGLNWGIYGINPDWNLVELIFGFAGWLESTVYILVGLSAVLLIFTVKSGKKTEPKEEMPEPQVEMPQNDMTM